MPVLWWLNGPNWVAGFWAEHCGAKWVIKAPGQSLLHLLLLLPIATLTRGSACLISLDPASCFDSTGLNALRLSTGLLIILIIIIQIEFCWVRAREGPDMSGRWQIRSNEHNLHCSAAIYCSISTLLIRASLLQCVQLNSPLLKIYALPYISMQTNER